MIERPEKEIQAGSTEGNPSLEKLIKWAIPGLVSGDL